MYPCACCGYLTQAEPPPDTHAICEVCDWEDDAVQLDDETFSGGANAPSLAEARANYARIGASDPDSLDRFASHDRKNIRIPRSITTPRGSRGWRQRC